jgi:acyl carrier protein
MADQSQTADRLITALGKEIKRDPATIKAEHKLRDDLGLNSLDAIELMFKVEEEFDLAIPDADLQKLATVGDLITYIDGRLNGTIPAGGPAPSPTPRPAVRPAAKPVKAKAPAAKPAKPTAKKTAAAKGRRRA